jgi:photosystem II stability/assembly factor-like uncharacterized protein
MKATKTNLLQCTAMRSLVYCVLLLCSACLFNEPARAQSPPPSLTSQELAGGLWQLTWSSIAGERYILERSSNLVQWTEVGIVDASGPTASLDDTGVPAGGRNFWRVRQVPAGPDTTPPSVSIISARYVTQGGQTALELSVTATDNIGVVAVNFSEGAVQLGAATAGPVPVWRRIIPLNAKDPNPRSFRASAGDAAGNTALSPFFTYVPGPDAPRFLPITGSGVPSSQGLLGLDQKGDLLPFSYSPGGNGGASPQSSLQLLFPEGGRVIQVDGRDTIEAGHLTLTFGPESPLQLPDGPLELDLPLGENVQVPLGELTIAQLLTSLGRPADSGVEVLLFGKFPLKLLSGTITESGILSPEWDFSALGLPLPDRVAPWAGGAADLLSGKEAVFPIAGVIPLPGLDGAAGPQLVIGRDRPLLLTLRPDCSIGLDGRADLEFPGGARFGVEVSLDDPNYCFTLRAESLTLPLASSLADLLPGNAAGCVPAVAQPAAMDTADQCLRAYLRAYRLFAREAEALRPAGPEDGFRRQPSNPDGAASAIADALAASLATPVAFNVPVQPLRDLAAFFNGTAANSPDSGAPAAVLAAIQRLEEALATIPAGPGEIPPDVRAEIRAAASAAARTIIRHAQDSVRAGSLPAIQKALDDLSIVDLSAGGFLDEELRAGVATARNNLATQWITGFALPLGIVSSSAGLTAELNALDRFAALQRVTDLVDFSASLQLAGMAAFPGSELLAPCRRLLLLRALQALQQQFDEHLAQENVPASLLDLADLTGLVADAALIGASDPAFPDNDDILARLDAISVLIDRELTLPRGERTFFDLAAKTRALLDAARVLPPSLPAAQDSMQRLHNALAAALTPQLTSEVALANLSPDGLFQLLQAGALYTRLGSRFGLTNSLPWEGQHLVNVTGLLAAAAESANAWPLLHEAALFLLDEANAIKNSPVQTPASPAARRLYQLQAAIVLEALRSTALQVWELSAAERAKSPPATLADAFLPGDLKIDRLTGGFCFNRLSGAFEGTFGGQLRLPKFNGALTISRGSFTSTGDFEIEAHGHLDFPPPPAGGQALVSADITASQPVRLSYSVARGLRFSGSMRVALSNGVTFTAAAAFLDPVYSFRFEAAGLNFDVLKAISSSLPGFPAPDGATALTYDEEKLGRWAELYTGFGGAAEQIADGGGGGGQARDNHDLPGIPSADTTWQSLRGWLAARELSGAGPPDAEVRERVTAYFAQQMRELIAQNALIDQLGGDPFAGGAGGGAAVRVPRGGPAPLDALQFDFGPGAQVAATGPAQSGGSIPADQLTWNFPSADTPGSLLKADGSAMSGAGLDFGKFPLLDDRNIDWSGATVPVALPAGGGSIYGDGTASFASFHETDNTGVAVRLTGLPAGAWRVFVPYSRMPFRTLGSAVDMTPGQLIRAGRERPSAPAAERLSLQMPVSLETIVASSTQWNAGNNFATWLVDLAPGDNLVVTSIGNGIRRTGFLQGLQVVRVPVVIEEFSVNPVSPLEGLSRGTPVTLRWRVQNATSLEIQPGIGPLSALEGQVVVNATQSTQYVLTARSASGETTAVASVVIAGQPDTKGFESALEDIADKLGDITDVLEDPSLAGETFDSAQLERFFCDPAGVDLGDIVRQRILGNESLKQDFGAVREAIEMGLSIQAIASLLGVECLDDLMNEIVAFVDDGIEIHERKIGKNADGSVDAQKVATFGAAQSQATISGLLDVYADMQSLGSDRVMNDALLIAHAENERVKLLAQIAYQAGPPVVTGVDNMESEEIYPIAYALLQNADRLTSLNDPLPGLPQELWGILGLAIERWAHLELSVTPRNQWRSLLQWIERVRTANTLLALGEQSGSFPSDIVFFGGLALDALEAEGERLPDGEALRLIEMLLEPATKRALGQPGTPPDTAMAEAWEEVMENFLIHLSGLIDELMDDEADLVRVGMLAEKLGQLGALVNDFRETGVPLGLIFLLEPANQLRRLTDEFDAAARARDQALKLAGDRKGRAALMFLRGSITARLTAAAAQLRTNAGAGGGSVVPRGGTDTPVRESLRHALAAMSADAAEIGAEIAALEAPNGLGDFGVPGGLLIERLGGSLYYNRDTGYLRGGLTGRLAMPGNGFFLDVQEATLDSDGTYSLDLTTGGTVPLGGSSKLLFDVNSLTAAGTADGRFSFAGAATLQFDGSAQPGDEFSLDVSTGFDSDTGLLAIGTGINTPLKFSDDIMLLDGSVDVEFSTTHPAGALVLDGKLALLSRGVSLPPGGTPNEDDFFLVLDINPTAFRFSETDFTAEFTGGTLTLAPELFSGEVNGQPVPASVALAGTLCLRYDFATRQIEFCAPGGQPFTLALSNLKLALQEIPGFGLLINNATLELSGTQFPVLKNLSANFQFPLPGMNATDAQQNRLASIDVTGKDWRIDGFPREVSFGLAQNLRIADLDGLDVDLLGGNALPGCATTFGLTSQEVGGQQQIQLALSGGMRVAFEQKLLDDADQPGTAVTATACGSFTWDFQSLPDFVLSTAQIEGRFALGGPNGVKIGGLEDGSPAVVTFSGFENLHRLTTLTPFTVGFTGAMEIANFVKFGLSDANMKWDGTSLVPAVTLGGAQASLGSEAVALAQGFLPVYPTMIGVEFLNPALPIFPSAGQTGLLDPLNVRLLLSGVVSIPPPVAGAPGGGTPSDLPGIGGSVDNLAITLMRQGDLIVPNFSINGLGLKLSGVDVPPLGGLNGTLYVGNLNDPANLYFAGSVGGTVNEVGAKISMGVHRSKGLLGAVFDLDVGPAGIPIDGGALGGILLTGGSGGLSFGNTFAQPADFLNSIQFSTVNGEKQPVNDGTSDAFPPTGAPSPLTYPTTPQVPGGTFNSCITGTFPPPTINPLCKPHPTIAGRVIFKGTNLHPTTPNTDLGPPLTLQSLGITPQTVPSTLQAAVSDTVQKLTQPVRDFASGLIAAVPPVVDPKVKAYYATLLNRQIRQLETSATGFLTQALGQAIGLNPNASLYDAIVAAAAKGMPCLDATLRLQGNFSHAAVSTVLKGKGAVTLSTTGTATLDGTIELIGIPVGEGVLAFSLTDTQGNINPSFGGVLHAGVGPLTLGDMSMAYECNGCFSAVLNSFQVFLATNVETMGAASRQLLVEMMNRTVPVTPPRSLNGDPGAFYVELTDAQKMAFVANLFNIVQILGEGQTLPPGITAPVVSGFIGSFQQFVSDVLLQVNPRFCFQAKVKPALFGFPLVPGPTPLDTRFAYEKVHDQALNQDFQQLSASTVFSPAFIMGALTTGGFGALLPASDQVNAGFSFRVPAFTPANVDLAMRNPAQFALNQFTTMVQDSTLTFGYAFMPLGIPLAEGQARMIMPRLINHPSNPGRPRGLWEAPAPAPYAPPSGGIYATRDEVIVAALVRGRLQDPNWRGVRGELDDLFFQPFDPPPVAGTPQHFVTTVMSRLDAGRMDVVGFAEDYFPHGGIIGASQLQLPKVLADALPADLIAKVFNPANPNWLADAQTLFTTYLTANTVVGQMAAYIPAPNVPQGFNFATGSPQELIDSLITGDPLAILNKTAPAGVYPFDQLMLSGWMKAQILGMPLADARVRFDAATGSFKAQAGISQGSWLSSFLGASAELEISKPAILNNPPTGTSIGQIYGAMPQGTVQERFQALQATLGTANINTVITTIQDTLPKTRLEVAANVQIPAPLQTVLRASGAANAQFFAFSPGFDRNFQLPNNSPYAVAKRRGGIGFRGAYQMGFFPPAGQPIVIDIPDASFAITPTADIALFPALTAQLLVGQISIPGAPMLRNGVIQFASSPDNLAPYLAIGGTMDPFKFSLPNPLGGTIDLLSFQSLNPGGTIGGELRISRQDGAQLNTAVTLAMDPMSAAFPMLGPGVAVTVHGGVLNNQFQRLSFSTQADQAWAAHVALSAPGNPNAAPVFSIRDPLNPGNPQGLMSFTPSGPVSGSISGVGLNSFQMQVTVPTGFNVTFFGGTGHQSVVNVPAGDEFTLYADSTGRFYVNLGGLTNLNLPGLMSANATIEFGYNPNDPQPNVTRTPTSRNFGTVNMADTVAQNVTVNNTGTLLANVSLSINQPGATDVRDFTVSSSGFQLEPGGSRTFPVTFQPKRSGARSATLEVSSDDPDTPLLTVSLSGSGLQEPRYFQSRDTIAFGDTLVGATSSDTITIGNTGSANMTISSVSVSGTGFTVSPAGAATVTPGQQRVYTLTYTPAALGASAGTLTINCAAPIGVKTIPLSGTGSESRWLTLLDSATAGSTAQLNAIRMIDSTRGLVVGSQGTLLETRNGGRSWIPRRLTNQSLNAIAIDRTVINNTQLALYHFEEPPGSTAYLDASGNSHHGLAVASPGTATLSFANGRFGSGLSLDGSNDYAELGSLTLPSSFSISLWAMFRENTNGQAILSKTTATGGNQLIFGKYNNGLQINFTSASASNQVWTVTHDPPLNIWTHFVVTGSYDSVANETTVTMIRRQVGGSSQTLGSNVFTGTITTSGGKRWSLGQEWDSSTLTTDHFNGLIDEVGFYDGVISSTERAALFTKNGARLVVAGSGGRVYQTFTDGDTWAQLPDLNAFGWRNQTRTFERYNWNAAAFTGGTLFLGGSLITTGEFGIQLHSRHVMEENLDEGLDNIAGNEDDEFAPVLFAHSNIGVNPQVTGLATTGVSVLGVTNEGVLHLKDTVEPVFFSRSPNTAPNSLYAVGAFGTANQYLAVGENGVVIRADGGAHAVVASGTTADLLGMAFDGNVLPSWHVVGEGGVYLTSTNNGANWQVVADGLTGNMRAVDVEPVPGGAVTEYHTWAAGANHTINYRPPAAVTGPFFTFFPGKLDFGFVTTGQSRTLTATLANKGKQPLQISSLVFTGPAAPRFSLGSTTVDRLEPGDSTQLNVRYRPTVASEFDAAELVLTTNDPNPAYRLALEGRSAANEWQPVTLLNAGLPFDGDVMKVAFTSSARGYALVNPPTGASVLYRTNDGGLTWTRNTFPTSGGVVKLTGFEFVRHTTSGGTTTDIGLASGHVEDAAGAFIRGLLLRCSTSITSFSAPSWLDRTPLASGQTTQPLRVFDASAISIGGFLVAAASTTGSTTTANVWRALDDLTSWTQLSNRPSGYPGGLVGVERYGLEPDFTFLFATGGGDVYSKVWTSTSWFTSDKRLSSSSTVKDMDFVLTPSPSGNLNRGWLVGNDGFFMLWEQQAATQAQQFFPAKDAEVFGTVDLTGVKFSDADNGWVVGDSRAFDSHDKGLTWSLAFDAGGLASFKTVATTSVSEAWIGGSLNGKATVWRYTPPPAAGRGLLSSVDQVDWGTVTPETLPVRIVRLNNSSSSALPLHDLSIDADDPAPRFRILSDLPDSIAASGFVDLVVGFSAFAEAPLAEEMQPEFLHRFEQAYDDAVLRDDSLNARHSNGSVAAAQRPKIVRSFFRDRCVLFDGGDDRVELSTAAPIVSFDTMPVQYSVALWAAPDTISGSRTLVSKDLNAGGDGLKITQTSTGYQVRIRSVTATFTAAPVAEEWAHLAFVFVQSGTNTLVTLYRDGALVSTQSIAAVAGSLAGRPWTFGAEWTSNTATTSHFSGCLDDIAVFARALTDGEVGRLVGKSPLFGEHRAQLLVNSGSEHGTRTIDLRALVAPAPKMLVFNTEPQGRQVTIDGVNYTTPVAFAVTAVASGAAGSREWVEGSQHRITTAEETFNLTASDGTVTTYGFSEWQSGGARSFELTASRSGSAAITAVFQPRSVTPPAPPGPPPPRAGGPNPLLAGLANSPKGPFFRLSNGSLKLPGLGATGFTISGEVLFSLQLIKGHIETTALNLPETGDKQLEIGASRWRFLATAGGDIELFAVPPSVRILGHDVLPSGIVKLRHTSAAGGQPELWAVEMTLQRDFKPWPDLLEIKKGFTRISWAPAVFPPVFALEFQSGLRLLKQPNGAFAFDQNMNVKIDTANFNISLNSLLTAAGIAQPPRLIQVGPFEVGWGDVRIRRTGGGPVFIEINNVPFRVNGTQVVNVSGSVNTDGALALSGAILQNGRINLDANGQTFLEKTTSGSANFSFLIQPLPSPRLRLHTPALRLKTTANGATGNVFPSSGISIPAITIDTSGDFDTGRLPLPAFDFDGINIDGDPNGSRKRNHIRLKRENGKVTFKIKSQQSFVGCRQKLSLTLESRTSATPKVKGSMSGNFCVLPDDFSLNYSSGSSCQFSGSAFGFTVRFGGSCAGVEENSTGTCVLGDCD